MTILFVHGVPDTPYMWQPLIKALHLPSDAYRALTLPGFKSAAPAGFTATKEAYTDWLISELQAAYNADGPVDLVGHDWGALLTVRAASLRPNLIRSWVASDALPDTEYGGHLMAKLWWTPLVGEAVMAVTTRRGLERTLIRQGVPPDIAIHEAAAWSGHMRASILRLYRSARGFALDWQADLENLPSHGLVIWGDEDPYVGLDVAERFCAQRSLPLHVETGAGHWAMIERAESTAKKLTAHWQSVTV